MKQPPCHSAHSGVAAEFEVRQQGLASGPAIPGNLLPEHMGQEEV
jgi:hypothetical protein